VKIAPLGGVPITPATSRAARKFTEEYVPADAVLIHAMSWAVELGVGSVTPAAGAVLRLLAAATRARSVVEIGTGTGVSGIWLLRGMRPDGVLTTIDIEPELQGMARQSFAAAGFPAGRARLIPGAAREVLPRLADGTYDVVFIDGDVAEYGLCVTAAQRLLRDGGVVVVNNALAGATPGVAASIRTAEVTDVVARLRDAAEWQAALIGAGEGLLCAAKWATAAADDPHDHGANVIQLRRP
jgi:predicted O-methyltransferase YrrM